MRVSTNEIFRLATTGILDQQATVNQTQLQLSSGKRILQPSDDPTGATQALELKTAISTTQQYERNADQVRSRLGLEEATLQSVVDNMQRVRELVVQANNDSQSNETRQLIAAEVRQSLDAMLQLANTRDANGEYIFAGFKSQTQPFALDGAGGATYSGDDGQRFLQISPVRQVPISDSGTAVFRDIANGNGNFRTLDDPTTNTGTGIIDAGSVTDFGAYVPDDYTITFTDTPTGLEYSIVGATTGVVAANVPYVEGADLGIPGIQVNIKGTPGDGDQFFVEPSQRQDIFATYQALASALETDRGSSADLADFHNAMNRALVDLDQSLGNVLDVRATIGARLNSVDAQSNINESQLLTLQNTLSGVEDLDYAEAISRFQQQLVTLQAAQQSFVKIQGLSLFNFIR
jgi:flagellar hook-associated protein 3 FlgL